MELPEFLVRVATQLVDELTPILSIKGVTANPELLGSYTEHAIRRLVTRNVHPMHVCTGAVLDHPIPKSLRQIDLIIWAPFPAPAIFEVDGFGLVPRSSVFGVIEIKRSNYSGVVEQVGSFLADVDARTIVGDPRGAIADYGRTAGLAIISVLETKASKRLQALLDAKRALAIFERVNGKLRVRPRDVLELVNFLHFITWRYRVHGSGPSYPQIDTAHL